MGLFGLFGGSKGTGGHKSKYLNEEEEGLRQAYGNRAGATSFKDASGRTQYDYSNVGKPIVGEAGVARAAQGYDFNPSNEAMQGYRNPAQMSQTYASSYQTPNYDFKSLPAEYGKMAYATGASDIRKEGDENYKRTAEATGVRRPGLLMKASAASGRDVASNLAKLNTQIRMKEMEDATNLAVKQQLAQDESNRFKSDEGYKEFDSRANLENRQADENFRNRQALAEEGRNKIGIQSGLLENERMYDDQALQNFYNLFNTSLQTSNQANQAEMSNNAARRGQTLGFMGSLAKKI